MPTPLTYAYRGIAGRAQPNWPAAGVIDPASNKVYDGAAFVADPAKLKRHPMTACVADPGLYLLNLSGEWPPTARVVVYDLASDPGPSDNGPAILTLSIAVTPPPPPRYVATSTVTTTLAPDAAAPAPATP